jgi:hypothetical protein
MANYGYGGLTCYDLIILAAVCKPATETVDFETGVRFLQSFAYPSVEMRMILCRDRNAIDR